MEIKKGTTSGSGTGGITIVTDGVTTVTSATELTFTGATVSNLGGGNVGVTITGGTGSPGGLNTQIQYNNSGVFGGVTGATTDGTIVSLNAPHLLNPTINGAGTGLATLVYPNTSTSVTTTVPATTGTLALTSQLRSVYLTIGPSEADYITTGTADDIQINAAIQAAIAAGGGEVHIKAGTYNLANTVTINGNYITLSGDGYATHLKTTNGSNANAITISGTGTIYYKVKSMWIDGNKANNTFGAGITLNTPWANPDPNGIFTDLLITDWNNNGIQFTINGDTRACKFTNIFIKRCNGNGLYMPFPSATDCTFDTVICDTISLNGMYLGGANHHYINCKMFYCGSAGGFNFGYYIAEYNNYFMNCEAQDNYQSGVYVDGTVDSTKGAGGCTFENCIFDSNSQNNFNQYTFTVTSANATAGATYINNSITYTVVSTISGATTLLATGTGNPTASGTLTKTGGTGDATIAFSANVISIPYGAGIQFHNVNTATIVNGITMTRNFPSFTQRVGILLEGTTTAINTIGVEFSGNTTAYSDISSGTNYRSLCTGQSTEASTIPGALNMRQNNVNFGTGAAHIVGSGTRMLIDGGSQPVEFDNFSELFLNSATPTIDMFSSSARTLLVQNGGGGTANLNVTGTIQSGGLTNGIVKSTSGVLGNATAGTDYLTVLTGAVTSSGNVTSLGSFTSASLATALTDETGSGSAVFANTPTLVTPVIGDATGTSLIASGVVTSDHFTSTSVATQSFIAGGLTVGDSTRTTYPFTVVGTNNTTGVGDFGLLGDVQLGTTTNNTIGFQHGQANTAGTVQTTAGWDFIGKSHTVGAQSTSIAWATRNAGSFSEKMRLDSTGNFSIGSTTVTSLFNVGSSAQFQVTSAGHVLVEGVTSTGATGTGSFVFGTTPTIATPVINGISTGTGVSVSSTVSTLVLRDTQGSTFAINHVNGFNSAATGGGTTTLTNVSNPIRVLTGTLAQTIILPVTSTLVVGYQYQITNQSTGTITVQSSGANNIIILASNTSATFTCVLASGTTAASWNVQYFGSIVPTAVGTATLVGGTVTVSTTAVTAVSKIFLTDATTGVLTNIGTPTVGTVTAGTSFVINSSNVLDTSNINWLIIN